MLEPIAKMLISGHLLFLAAAVATEEGVPPVIKEHPHDVVARRNDPATLNCAAAGATTITWYRGGERVVTSSEDPRSHRVLLPSGSLFFLRVATGRRDTDAGTYWCEASNTYGVSRSHNATLTVASISYDFQLQPEALVKVKVGDHVVLPCRPPKGSPKPSVHWLKDGEEIGNSSRTYSSQEGDLIINKTSNQDLGDYVCVAQNIAGNRESLPTSLVIMNPPRFQERPNNITTASGVTVELACKALGSPTPRITWYKIDGKIPYGRSRIEKNKLIIEFVVAVDSGVYICEATNDAGRAMSNITLTVVDAPVLSEKPQVIRTVAGSKIELSCKIEGNPRPLTVWRLPTQNRTALLIPSQSNGHATVSKTGQKLTIEESSILDSGIYYCWGISSGGGVSAQAKVMVVSGYPPPIIGIGPNDLTVRPGSTISLPCEVVSEFATPTVLWFYSSPGSSVFQQLSETITFPRMSLTINGALIIKDIQTDDAGIYTCSVKSDTGTLMQKAILEIDEKAKDADSPSLPAPPSKPLVTAINESSVHLRWLPNSQVSQESNSWYRVEFWKHGWKEWRVANANVKQEECIIQDLKPGVVYNFLVRAVSKQGASFPSPWSDPFLTQGVGDTNLTVEQIHLARRRLSRPAITLTEANITGPSSILLTWKFLITAEAIEGVHVYNVADDGTISVATVLGSSSSTLQLHNLIPNTGYTFFMVPFWHDIEGTPSNSISLITPEDIPVISPSDVQVTLQDDGSTLISWSPLTSKEARGDVVGYQVTLTYNGSQALEIVSEPFLSTEEVVPGQLYTIRVAAQTGAGLGPFSPPLLVDYGSSADEPSLSFDSTVLVEDSSVMITPPKRLHQNSGTNPSHRPTAYQGSTVYSARNSINMYGEPKMWKPNGYGSSTLSSVRSLPSDHQLNEYSDPRIHRVEVTEPYATTSLLMPQPSPQVVRGNTKVRQQQVKELSSVIRVNWSALIPPPPTCPPPHDLDLGDLRCQNSSEIVPNIYTASSEYDNVSSSAKYKRPCDAMSEQSHYIYSQLPVRRGNSSVTFQNTPFHSSWRVNNVRRPRRPTHPPYNNTQ